MSGKLSCPLSRLTCTGLLAALSFGGCVAKSFTPAVDKADRVVDSRLAGKWLGEDKQTALVEAHDSEYAVLVTDKDGKQAPFDARLGRLGRRWVLDVVPDGAGLGTASEVYKGLLLPTHTFLIIDSIGPSMTVSTVKPDSLKDYLEHHPDAIAHMDVEDDLVLTAPTPELRAFLERYITRPGVLEPGTWKKD